MDEWLPADVLDEFGGSNELDLTWPRCEHDDTLFYEGSNADSWLR